MKKLIYNENTKEIDVIEQEKTDCFEEIKKNKDYKEKEENITKTVLEQKEETIEKIESEQKGEKKDFKNCLEIVKIFCEIFSSIFLGIMGIVLTFSGNNIDKQIKGIYERQLKIMESENEPYFILEHEGVWDKVEETQETEKIANVKYTLTNTGGKIRDVMIRPESYTIFYVPTGKNNEWYIFKYMTNNFRLYRPIRRREEERGKKFVFYEYISEKLKNKKDTRDFEITKYLSKNLNIDENLRNEITYVHKDILYIDYIDYMGERKSKIFEMFGSGLEELEKDIDGVHIGVRMNAIVHDSNGELKSILIDTYDTEEVGKRLKEEIEEWLENNKDAKGYKDSAHSYYDYDLELYNTEVGE